VLPDAVRRFWTALIELSPAAEPFEWGFVQTDPRFPDVWDANNATVLTPTEGLSLTAITDELVPRLRATGASAEHVEFWETDVETPALREARAIGTKDRTDVVMVFDPALSEHRPSVEVQEVGWPDDAFWPWYRRSLIEFDPTDLLPEHVLDQLVERTRRVFVPAGERFFLGLIDGVPAGYTALLRLDGVGYLDNVVTMPEFRRRGVASSTVLAAVQASRAAGDDAVFLLADEHGRPRDLYERLGFREAGRIETLNRPLTVEGRRQTAGEGT
jgi:ribosomal protein S18 acetylase RimI-like enzyme